MRHAQPVGHGDALPRATREGTRDSTSTTTTSTTTTTTYYYYYYYYYSSTPPPPRRRGPPLPYTGSTSETRSPGGAARGARSFVLRLTTHDLYIVLWGLFCLYCRTFWRLQAVDGRLQAVDGKSLCSYALTAIEVCHLTRTHELLPLTDSPHYRSHPRMIKFWI